MGTTPVGRVRSSAALCLLLVLIVQAAAPSDARAIVGGQPAATSGSTVAIVTRTSSLMRCSGVLIDAVHVLTVSRCAAGLSGERVVAGATTPKQPGPQTQVLSIASAVVHPLRQVSVDDIAVLTLATPAVLGAGVVAATLPAPGATPADGAAGQVDGFGAVAAGASATAGTLHSLPTVTYGSGSCALRGAHAVTLCARSSAGGTCNPGDLGAPLTIAGVLVGINTRYNCAPGGSTTFVNLAAPEVLRFVSGDPNPPQAPRLTRAGRLTSTSARVGEIIGCIAPVLTLTVTSTIYDFVDPRTGAVLQSSGAATYAPRETDSGRPLVCITHSTNDGGTVTVTTKNAIAQVGAVRRQLSVRVLSHTARVRRGGRLTVRVRVSTNRPAGRAVRVCLSSASLFPRVGNCVSISGLTSRATRTLRVKVGRTVRPGTARGAITARASGMQEGVASISFTVARSRAS